MYWGARKTIILDRTQWNNYTSSPLLKQYYAGTKEQKRAIFAWGEKRSGCSIYFVQDCSSYTVHVIGTLPGPAQIDGLMIKCHVLLVKIAVHRPRAVSRIFIDLIWILARNTRYRAIFDTLTSLT